MTVFGGGFFSPPHTFHFPHHRLLTTAFNQPLVFAFRSSISHSSFPQVSSASNQQPHCVWQAQKQMSKQPNALHLVTCRVEEKKKVSAVVSFVQIQLLCDLFICFFTVGMAAAWSYEVIFIRHLFLEILFFAWEPSSFQFILCDAVMQLFFLLKGL